MCAKVASRAALDADARVVTGIPGFDEMLEGGFPAGSLISLAGRPGTGKTIFGSQFLTSNRSRNRDCSGSSRCRR